MGRYTLAAEGSGAHSSRLNSANINGRLSSDRNELVFRRN